jgi:hypothetical protein
MKYLIWKRKIFEPDFSKIYDTLIINIEEEWYYTIYIHNKKKSIIYKTNYKGIMPDIFDKAYREFTYYKLDIDDKYIESLKSKDPIISEIAYINILCIKNKVKIYKNELKIIFKKMRET